MAFFRKLLQARGVDVMRLDLLMSYSTPLRSGIAAVRWADPMGGGSAIRAILVALLYGRIFCVHKETSKELFDRVGDLAVQNVRSEGATGFEFTSWVLRVGLGGGNHTLWPWEIVPPEQIAEPKIYSAILKQGNPTPIAPLGRWVHLEMAFGLERVLAPSSALIALSAFSRSSNQEARYYLALLLWQMNEHWRSGKRVFAGSESMAYAAAEAAVRFGELQIP